MYIYIYMCVYIYIYIYYTYTQLYIQYHIPPQGCTGMTRTHRKGVNLLCARSSEVPFCRTPNTVGNSYFGDRPQSCSLWHWLLALPGFARVCAPRVLTRTCSTYFDLVVIVARAAKLHRQLRLHNFKQWTRLCSNFNIE